MIGCLDGTQVKIMAPSVNEHEYVNRKGVHSINVQVQYVTLKTQMHIQIIIH